jgi:hypothetical protein
VRGGVGEDEGVADALRAEAEEPVDREARPASVDGGEGDLAAPGARGGEALELAGRLEVAADGIGQLARAAVLCGARSMRWFGGRS